jgi:membrane-associated phospholipid phosphatase
MSTRVFFLSAFLLAPAFGMAQVSQLFPSQLMQDQKDLLKPPAKLVEGKNVVKTAAVIAASVSLIELDPVDEPFFRRTTAFRGFNNVFTSKATEIGTIAAPAALLATGFLRGDAKMQRSSVLAAEALVDAETVAFALKKIVPRQSPTGAGSGSFPSGHAIAAFAAATVFARRYSNHKWAPFVAYALAGAVGFSRVTSSAHYVSDVFVGSALGYAIGRFTAGPAY